MKKLILSLSAIAAMSVFAQVNAQDNNAVKPSAQTQVEMSDTPDVKDKVDASIKGPNGEVIYTDSQGGKYYKATNNKKVYTDCKVDINLKGPKGEAVYTGHRGGKYYINAKGEKIFTNANRKTDNPTPVKQGTIKKADSSPSEK